MSRIIVDGEEYEVTEGENLLHACLSHGLDLPYFCWHPAMGSVGACRQCAVVMYADEDDTRGRLTMSCMTPVADGARIDIKAPHAESFRASVIEWLMENHPHDCPVCEEGGECHLQDMTVMTGHTTRRYRGNKRTFENQNLGPFINHEMNRCITCYRCVRFYRDYAGGTDLEAFGSRDRMYFGRAEPGVLESEFSGNLVEVCPTGVFTDKPFSAMYARKWDLQSAPSICTGCSLGCNTFASERYGSLNRIQNRYHAAINKYFICDRGRFGMSYVNSESRIRFAGERTQPGVFRALDAQDAIVSAAQMIGAGNTIGIGSPRASLEDNWALKKLVGEDNFCAGFSTVEATLMQRTQALSKLDAPSLTDMETADAVLVLGEDLLNTAPRLALAIRQSTLNLAQDMATDAGIPQWQDAGVRGHAQHAINPIFIASVLPTRLDDIAQQTFNGAPSSLARCGFEIAHQIDTSYPGSDNLSPGESEFVSNAVAALRSAQNPLIVTGVACEELALLDAAANIVQALQGSSQNAKLAICGAEANSFGVSQLDGNIGIDETLRSVVEGQTKTLLIMQNDLFRRSETELVKSALAAAEHVIVIDCLDNPTANEAHLVLPAATVAESTGTLVNYERRAQRFYQVFEPSDAIQPTWRWLVQLAAAAGRNDFEWPHVDDVLADLAKVPGFAGVTEVAPGAAYRSSAGQKIPRETHRYSGRTAMDADKTLHEPKTKVDEETPFSYSMEGANAEQPGALIPYVWSPGWNSNQSVFKFQQEVGGELRGGDPGVHLQAHPAALEIPTRYSPAAVTQVRPGEGFQLLATPILFGGEELSAYSPAINQRMQPPFIVVHPDDAARLGVSEGDGLIAANHSLEVRTNPAMTPGMAAIPVGLPNAPSRLPSHRVELARDENFVRRPIIIARG